MEAKTQNPKKINLLLLFFCIFIIGIIGTSLWAYSEEGLDIFSHITDVLLLLGISLIISIFITLIIYKLKWAITFGAIIIGVTIIKLFSSLKVAGGESSLFYIGVIFFEIIFAVIVIILIRFLVRWLNRRFSITF